MRQLRAQGSSFPLFPSVPHASAALANRETSLEVQCSLRYEVAKRARKCKTSRGDNPSDSVQPPPLPFLTLLHLHADLAAQVLQRYGLDGHPFKFIHPAKACTTGQCLSTPSENVSRCLHYSHIHHTCILCTYCNTAYFSLLYIQAMAQAKASRH